MALGVLAGSGEEVDTFNRCWSLWKNNQLVDAYKECEKIDTTRDASRVTARAATRLKAEVLFKYLQRDSTANQEARKYIGSLVLVEGDAINLEPGKTVKIGYMIDGEANIADLMIRNTNGTPVYQAQLEMVSPGKVQQVTWKGLDLTDSELPAGKYSIAVNATSKAPNEMPPKTKTYIEGRIEGINTEPGFPEFLINKR
jgi:hypothetical protein